MLKFGLDDFNSGFGELLDVLRELPTLDPLAQSEQLLIIAGQAAQRRIDRQGYKELNQKYAIKTAAGRKGILRLKDDLYNRLLTKEAYNITGSSDGQTISIELADPIGRGQTKGGRPVLEPDQVMADQIVDEEIKVIDGKLQRLK